MTQAKLGDTVLVHYTGKLEDGTIFDSSLERQPLQFSIGSGEVIPGFEQAAIGMSPGQSKTEVIESDRAYGPYHPEMVLVVERQQIPQDVEVAEGQQLHLQHPTGEVIPVTITQIDDAQVVLDANHPLAGRDLTFEIHLVAINA